MSDTNRYEWVQAGGTEAFSMPPPAALTFDFVPDNGIALKRVVARDFWVSGASAGNAAGDVGPAYVRFDVHVGGSAFAPGPIRYSQVGRLETTATVFNVEGTDVYNVWWGGAGVDIGFDEGLIAGSVLDTFPVFVRIVVSLIVDANWEPPMGFNWNGTVKCLFAYPS